MQKIINFFFCFLRLPGTEEGKNFEELYSWYSNRERLSPYVGWWHYVNLVTWLALSNFATLRVKHYALDFPTAGLCLIFSHQMTKVLPKWSVISKVQSFTVRILLKNLGRMSVKTLNYDDSSLCFLWRNHSICTKGKDSEKIGTLSKSEPALGCC